MPLHSIGTTQKITQGQGHITRKRHCGVLHAPISTGCINPLVYSCLSTQPQIAALMHPISKHPTFYDGIRPTYNRKDFVILANQIQLSSAEENVF